MVNLCNNKMNRTEIQKKQQSCTGDGGKSSKCLMKFNRTITMNRMEKKKTVTGREIMNYLISEGSE